MESGNPMNSALQRELEIFAAACALKMEERGAYLERACQSEAGLRQRVEALLAAHDGAGDFLRPPSQSILPPTLAIAATERPGDRIGRYKLLQQIGEGGCGIVYMAEQEEPVRRRVALKVIKLGMDTKSVIARFEVERQALALMDHAHIAKVLDAGATDAGRPYFVMELVKGIRITEYCDQNNLSTSDRLALFTKVCSAIQHAHQKGIIHRDIKPSNILVTLHDGVPVPKVIDFGIAKATDQRLTDKTLFTAFEQFIGTPAYMSPEQAEMSGLDIDTRTDIYSLGVLLYELLTGRTPFDAKELLAAGLDGMRRTIREQEPMRPSTRLSTMIEADRTTVAKRRQAESKKLTALLRGDLDWIVMKALEKDRTRRYDSAGGFAQDVERYLNHEAILARPPSAFYRFGKLARRHRLIFTAATIVTTAITIATCAIWVAAQREGRARVQETIQRHRAEDHQRRAETNAAELSQLLYVADMGAAFHAFDDSNYGRVRELLDRYIPKPGEKDRRGWEWRHLAFRVRDQTRLVLPHPEGVFGAVFTPNTGQAVTVARDSKLRVWDLATQQTERTIDNIDCGYGMDKPLVSPDGRWLAARRQSKLVVWDMSGPDWNLVYEGSKPTAGFVFLGDGRQIFDRGTNSVSLVKAGDWTATETKAELEFAQWLPIASDAAGSSVLLWQSVFRKGSGLVRFDVERSAFSSSHSNISRTALYAGHFGALAWSSQNFVAGGTRSGVLLIWKANEDTLLVKTNAHSQGIYALAFNPAGDVVATVSHDQKIILWAAPSGRKLATLLGHQRMVLSVAFSSDGKSLITGAGDKTVRIWDVSALPDQEPLYYQPRSKTFTPDSQQTVGLGIRATANLARSNEWLIAREEVKRPGWVQRLPLPIPDEEVPDVEQSHGLPPGTISPDCRLMARLKQGSTLELLEITSRKPIGSHDFGPGDVRNFAFSPTENLAAIATQSRRAALWNWEHNDVRTLPADLTGDVRSLRFVPGGKQLLLSDGRGKSRIVDVHGTNVVELARHPYESVSFSSDGRFMTVPDFKQRSVRVMEVPTGREVCVINRDETGLSESEPTNSAVSAGGEWVAISDTEGTVTLWNTHTRRKVGTPMKGHLGSMSDLLFSPDNRLLVSGAWDETVRVWHVATQRELTSFKDALNPQFSPDGQTLMVWQRGGSHLILHAPSLEEMAASGR